MRAEQIIEDFPVVRSDSNALDAVRLTAEGQLPGLLVVDREGRPWRIVPASQVARLLLPAYVQDDPALAGVLSEGAADHVAERLSGRTVEQVLSQTPPEVAVVNADDTIIEVAATMAGEHTPLVAVMDRGRLLGVITASGLLRAALGVR